MSVVVTGATGHLGRLIVEHLISRGLAPSEITATGRDTAKLADLAGLGVHTAEIDYTSPATLEAAFTGADAVMLVSGDAVGQRVEQHQNVIDAAVKSGVRRIVYTSAPKATTSPLILAPEHKATEELISASGLAFTILRNGWYTENYAGTIAQAAQTGELVSSVGDGRVSSASRSDYADAAAVVLTTDGHEGAVYELSGDYAWNTDELAAALTEVVGRTVVNHPVTPEELTEILTTAGLDAGTVGFVVALDQDTRAGLLGETSGDLAKLIGRPTVPLVDGLRAAA